VPEQATDFDGEAPRRPAVGVAADALCGFKGAVIFQKIRDAGRPE